MKNIEKGTCIEGDSGGGGAPLERVVREVLPGKTFE